MRIETNEPSLTSLFEKGQVGLIRQEFQRQEDVIASLKTELECLKSKEAATSWIIDSKNTEIETLKKEIGRLSTDVRIEEMREYFLKFCNTLIDEKSEYHREFVEQRARANGLAEENKRLLALNSIDQRTINNLKLTPEWSEITRLTGAYRELESENRRLNEIILRECDGGVDVREEAQRTVDENHQLRAKHAAMLVAGDQVCKLGEKLIEAACKQMPVGINGPDVFAFTRAVKDWDVVKEVTK